MATLSEWLNGVTSDGELLDPRLVDKYRREKGMISPDAPKPVAPRRQVPRELVGDALKSIIDLMGLTLDSADCGCTTMQQQMNEWGIKGCIRNRSLIERHLRKNAPTVPQCIFAGANLAAAGIFLNVLNPYGSLLDVAISKVKSVTIAYGVTTCMSRLNTYLPATLKSLANAGFDFPHLFVDGVDGYVETHGLPSTLRQASPGGPYSSWMASAWELYTRNPDASFYLLFQDDIIVSKSLRAFIERSRLPHQGYFNLCTYPENAARPHVAGWFKSDQLGKGAQALLFPAEAMEALLSSKHLAHRVRHEASRRWKYIDGAIVTAMKQAGYLEYVHDPSPVCHIGEQSSISDYKQPETALWRGEDYEL